MSAVAMMRRLLTPALIAALAALLLWGLPAPESSAQSTITVQFERADYNVLEGRNLSPTLTFSIATSSQATFSITTTAGTATAGTDFAAGPHTCTVPSGRNAHVCNIPILADSHIEDYETLTITIDSPPSGFALGTNSSASVQVVNVSIVPENWSLIPSDVNPGEQFRLLFKTETERDANSANIGDYDTFVRNRISGSSTGHTDIRQYAPTFRVVGSTPAVDAAWHTATGIMVSGEPSHTDLSHKIYWLNGPKIADDYNDFYDGTWDNNNDAHMRNANGNASTNTRGPNTGTSTGNQHSNAGVAISGKQLGTSGTHTRWGGTGGQNPINQGDIPVGSDNVYIGLSGVFEVAAKTLSFDTTSFTLDEGETLTVSLTASEAHTSDVTITITATPDTADADDWSGGPWTVTLASGQTSVSFDIEIAGDSSLHETMERFTLTFTSVPSGYLVDPSAATVTVDINNVIPLTLVPYDWPLRPEGLNIGDRFRLLFVTKNTRTADDDSIDVFNAFVRDAAANGHSDIRAYSKLFGVFASTGDIDARLNTGLWDADTNAYTDDSTGNSSSGIPIYWINGDKIANNYHHFLHVDNDSDNTWTAGNYKTEHGDKQGSNNDVLTGSEPDGTKDTGRNTLGRYSVGNRYVIRGILSGGDPISHGATQRNAQGRLYGLSTVFEVEPVPTFGFEREDGYNIREGTTLSIPVVISEAQLSDITVTVTATAGTATPDDWTGGPWNLTIPAGQTSATFDLSIPADTKIEGAEAFTLTVTSVPSGYAPDPDTGSVTVQIVDVNVVPNDWALTPVGITAGQQFRLVFLGDARNAENADIATYDAWVQSDASASGTTPTPHAAIQDYSSTFRMVGSTEAVDAAFHTATGILQSSDSTYGHTAWTTPIHWLGGGKIADDHNDFWDGTWDAQLANDTRGTDGQAVASAVKTWTGTQTGTTHATAGTASTDPLGHSGANVRLGQWGASNNPVSQAAEGKVGSRRILGISQIFQAETPAATPTVSITADAGAVTEGNNATFTVTASPAPSATITVNLSVTQTGDFGVTPGSRTVAIPTTGSASITVSTGDDNVDEANGSVTVTVDTGTGYTPSMTSASATVSINDDDQPVTPQVSFAAATSTVSENSGSTDLVLNFNPAPSGNITLKYELSGTATLGTDYTVSGGTGTSRTMTVSAGTTSVNIPIAIIDDSAGEGAETIIVTILSSTQYARNEPLIHTRTISASDGGGGTPVLTIAGGSAVTEGNNASFTISSNPAPSGSITVRYTVSQNGQFVASGQLGSNKSRPISASNTTFTIPTLNDNLDEANGSVTVALNNGTGYTIGSPSSATVTVNDNDVPTAQFASGAGTFAEGGGTRNVRVNLSPTPYQNITVNYTLSGTAVRGTDYGISGVTSNSGTASVIGGATFVDIPVAITDDNTAESSETVILTLNTGTGYALGTTRVHTLTVTDNDGTGTPVANFARSASSAAESAGTRNVTLNLNPTPTATVTVSYAISGTATRGTDYTISGVTSNTGTIQVGTSGTATIPVAITDDGAAESAETVVLTLASGQGYNRGATRVHTLTITDNDTAGVPVLTIRGGSAVTEGGSASFTVSSNPVPGGGITVRYTVTQSGRFVASGELGSGKTRSLSGRSTTFTIPTVNDSADESNGSVRVTLNAGSGYTLGSPASATAAVAVRDNDPPPTSAGSGSGSGGGGRASTASSNAPPVFLEGRETTRTVASGLEPGASVGGPLRVRDRDSTRLVWTVSGDSAARKAFSVDADTGQIRTRIALDHEEQGTYRLVVLVRDSEYDSDDITVIVTVTAPQQPTGTPTPQPTGTPTPQPTATPTPQPTATPTPQPTATPTPQPTATPTPQPTATPTLQPTTTPVPEPTATPTPQPTATPTLQPAATPTPQPTTTPVPEPTMTPAPPPVEPGDGGGVPAWVWAVALLVIALIAVAVYIYARSR